MNLVPKGGIPGLLPAKYGGRSKGELACIAGQKLSGFQADGNGNTT